MRFRSRIATAICVVVVLAATLGGVAAAVQVGGATLGGFAPGDCPIPRQAGDLLVTYDYPGGDGNPTVGLYKWQPAAHPDGNHDGDWVDQSLSSDAARAAVNSGAIDDPSDGSIGAGRF